MVPFKGKGIPSSPFFKQKHHAISSINTEPFFSAFFVFTLVITASIYP
jgi:hypothetical protein